MKNLFVFLFGNIQKTCASVMIIGGIALPLLFQDNTKVGILGSVFAALGGAAISASTDFNEIARRQLAPRLIGLTRYLVTFINQLAGIKTRVDEGDLQPAEALEHVAELLPAMRALVTDFTQVTGEQFDPAVHNSTIAKMTEMITSIESKSSNSGENKEELVEQANALRAARSVLEAVAPASGLKMERVVCPHCKHEKLVELGVTPPASALPRCDGCGMRFHVHRARDGSAFTKTPGVPRSRAADSTGA